MQRPTVPVVAGPTASGKTAVAVELARLIDGEIISADSMQVYKHLSIGTAKPTSDELQSVPYHLVNHVEPDEQYHMGRFVQEASLCIDDIRSRNHQPIVCGGTGLYIRGLLYGIHSGPERDSAIRKTLEQRIESEGLNALHDELHGIDTASSSLYGPNDRQRILRALEVYYATGRPLSSYHTQNLSQPQIPSKMFVLSWPRAQLYDRINKRVEEMLDQGLLEEVSNYLLMGYDRNNPAIKALGYNDIIDYVQGRVALEDALEAMKKKSRNYAKRQETWFRSMKNSCWIESAAITPAEIARIIVTNWEKLED